MGGASSTNITGGFRLFRVVKNSPAEKAGLEIFFDFIISLDDLCLVEATDAVQAEFFRRLADSSQKTVHLSVYNARTRAVRELDITPHPFEGEGVLGVTLRYNTVDNALAQSVRVMNVHPNSPAAHAGVIPYTDYLLGASQTVFKDADDLIDCVSGALNRELSIYVYNSFSETIREVCIVPNNDWGGNGCLGCDIGTGYLHHIPLSKSAVSPPHTYTPLTLSNTHNSKSVLTQTDMTSAQHAHTNPQDVNSNDAIPQPQAYSPQQVAMMNGVGCTPQPDRASMGSDGMNHNNTDAHTLQQQRQLINNTQHMYPPQHAQMHTHTHNTLQQTHTNISQKEPLNNIQLNHIQTQNMHDNIVQYKRTNSDGTSGNGNPVAGVYTPGVCVNNSNNNNNNTYAGAFDGVNVINEHTNTHIIQNQNFNPAAIPPVINNTPGMQMPLTTDVSSDLSYSSTYLQNPHIAVPAHAVPPRPGVIYPTPNSE